MGLSYWTLSLEYATVISTQVSMAPIDSAHLAMAPLRNIISTMDQPSSSLPSIFFLGTLTSLKRTSHSLSAAVVGITSQLIPGVFESTMKRVIPFSGEAPSFVLVTQRMELATWAISTKSLVPFIMKSFPFGVALTVIPE